MNGALVYTEQAQKDFASGRVGAARMNAKLATIYDPDNEEFKRIVAAWDEKPKAGTSGASTSRPEYVVLYEQAQDLEDEGNVDGALIISHHTGDDFVAELETTMPVVFGGRPSNADDLDAFFVDVDNAAGAETGTQRLLDIGRRRIGSIAGAGDMPAGIDRLTGFRRTLERAGLPTDAVELADFTAAGGAAATRRLLERYPDLRLASGAEPRLTIDWFHRYVDRLVVDVG